ncbi:MAG TPA: SURF1 family cytochrome oxidase biogenesis protein [Lacisediminihabitans sp.]|jgi:cytochrome oxidase assembly protein ShyY1|nr:SURF1 family cytochrome oxidase biogenesis protein [Lacisediminihabitans sp.]HXD61703.1 SURF1 family cytochrome oxidase biogenesis protein [Lacisediminihabitans sp.]
MWSVARRPRWIAMLVLALVVAAGFAALSQWQLARAVATGTVVVRDTENAVPLDTVATPQSPVREVSNGQNVTVSGQWVPADYLVFSDRLNNGRKGYWVVGHLSADTKTGTAGLPVALGWSPSENAAKDVATALSKQPAAPVTITGRYLPGEAPQDTDFEHGALSSVAPATIVNLWKTVDPAGIYGGFVVIHSAVPGLDRIDSPVPTSDVELNWLNIFYAVEWVVFAGFAFFLWYRLVKDAWEREVEEELEAMQAASDGSADGAAGDGAAPSAAQEPPRADS